MGIPREQLARGCTQAGDETSGHCQEPGPASDQSSRRPLEVSFTWFHGELSEATWLSSSANSWPCAGTSPLHGARWPASTRPRD